MDEIPYNQEDLYNHLKTLLSDGFYLNEDGFLVKDEANRKIIFNYGYTDVFPLSVRFTGGGVRIRINEVEDIMRHVFLATNYKYEDADPYNSTFEYNTTKEVLSLDEENTLYDIRIQDDASFNQARPYLERLRDAGLLFAAQYPTLQSLYDYGETLAEPDKFSFYSSNTRMLVVYKLLNKPYESQANHLINYYTSVGQTDTANFIQALKDYLDTL